MPRWSPIRCGRRSTRPAAAARFSRPTTRRTASRRSRLSSRSTTSCRAFTSATTSRRRRWPTAPSASTARPSSIPTSRAGRLRCAPPRPTLISRRPPPSATKSGDCATRSWACRAWYGRPDRRVLTLVERWLKKSALEIQEYVYLTCSAFYGVFTRPFYRHDIVEQFDQIGAGSMTVVLLAGLFTGAALASQSGLTLDQFGARPVVGRLVSASMIKELGPVLTALMLTGRIGSGIAAELGSMVVTDQINALRALGTDPIRKLVFPRVFAGLFMAPVLTVISDFVGILGGWMVARFQLQVASGLYWSSITEGLYMQDVWMGLIKPFVLGFAIVTIACHVGLRTSGGTQGVGKATTIAVVAGSVAVIAADFFVTQVIFMVLY